MITKIKTDIKIITKKTNHQQSSRPYHQNEAHHHQVRNALRYFPPSCHAELAPEFARELDQFGHIYMYRWPYINDDKEDDNN